MPEDMMQPTPHAPPGVRGLGRVVVATDFSPSAQAAVARAACLPLGPAAEVHLVHVLARRGKAQPEAREQAEVLRRLGSEALALQRRLTQQGPVEVVPEVRVGRPDARLVQSVEDLRAELLVLGRPRAPAHGHPWTREVRLSRLLRMDVGALLFVSSQPTRPYRHPLAVVSLSAAAEPVLRWTARLSPGAHQQDVLHVCDDSYELVLHRLGASATRVLAHRQDARSAAAEAVEELVRRCRADERASTVRLGLGAPEAAITQAVEASGADLLVVGIGAPTGRPALQERGLVEDVLGGADCDVAVVHTSASATAA